MRRNFRRRKFNRKRKSTYKIFFLILVGMTVGFAAINTTLQLIGTLNISRTTWNIHWENPTKVGGVTATQEVHLKSGDNTTVEYQVKLENPGDYYEFTVDAKNDGTIDGMITSISNKVYENNVEVNPTYLESTITYTDGTTIANNHLLASGEKETYKVKVQYKAGLYADQLPDSEKTYNFRFTVTYMQADENAKPVRIDFATSSWDDIIDAYNDAPTQFQQTMEAGTTREIQMDLDNDETPETYRLRIANISTPAVCSTQGFSQTACGLVLEFVDNLTSHRMNPDEDDGTSNGNGNYGGWEYSEMRTFVNSDIYNALPSDLKSKIINTTVVSGHGSEQVNNFTTTDKIYLLSTKEVWGKEGTSNVVNNDSAEAETRQLDYYHSKGVTTDNYSAIGKNGSWWLRTPYSSTSSSFYYVDDGDWRGSSSTFLNSVSPAFRIG